jgi:hypothetical protein
MANDEFWMDCDEHTRTACRLLPAWFVPRMMTDYWSFALLLTTGHTVNITDISDVRMTADGLWIDVELADRMPLKGKTTASDICAPTTQRIDLRTPSRHGL